MRLFFTACFYVQMLAVFFCGGLTMLHAARYLQMGHNSSLFAGAVSFAGTAVNLYLACSTFVKITRLP